jgi:archaellum component FlaC
MSDNGDYAHEALTSVSDSLKSVMDITSRIDERVKVIMEKQNESDKRFVMLMEHFNNLSARVAILESKDNEKLKDQVEHSRSLIHELEKQVQVLKISSDSHTDKWKGIIQNVVQVITTIGIGYILWKLGLPAP